MAQFRAKCENIGMWVIYTLNSVVMQAQYHHNLQI